MASLETVPRHIFTAGISSCLHMEEEFHIFLGIRMARFFQYRAGFWSAKQILFRRGEAYGGSQYSKGGGGGKGGGYAEFLVTSKSPHRRRARQACTEVLQEVLHSAPCISFLTLSLRSFYHKTPIALLHLTANKHTPPCCNQRT